MKPHPIERPRQRRDRRRARPALHARDRGGRDRGGRDRGGRDRGPRDRGPRDRGPRDRGPRPGPEDRGRRSRSPQRHGASGRRPGAAHRRSRALGGRTPRRRRTSRGSRPDDPGVPRTAASGVVDRCDSSSAPTIMRRTQAARDRLRSPRGAGPAAGASRWSRRWSRPRWTTARRRRAPGPWTRAHVADALAVWFPRTVALLHDDRDAVPAALHALIGFLAERDWLDSRSDPRRGLHTQVDDSTPALHDALDDERNHDLGTFWAVQMLRHGVPTADPAAVARFIERVHAGELDIDRAALRDITRRERRADPSRRAARCPPCCCPGRRPCWPPRTRRSRSPGCAASPAGCARPSADPRPSAPARRRPRRRRGARPRPLRPRPRPRGRRAPRDVLLVQLGAPGPASSGWCRAGWCR